MFIKLHFTLRKCNLNFAIHKFAWQRLNCLNGPFGEELVKVLDDEEALDRINTDTKDTHYNYYFIMLVQKFLYLRKLNKK